jgi:hypothetical protein
VPAREAESELNLLKISRFQALEAAFQPIFAVDSQPYIKFPP